MLEQIRQAIRARRFNVTNHADEEIQNDRLSLREVLGATDAGEVIESYPTDFPFPSCLILGRTDAGEPVHAVWAFEERTGIAVLITVYRPDPNRWIDYRVRRASL